MIKLIIIGIIISVGIGCGQSNKLKYQVVIDNDYNTLFTRTDGWTGGDVAHTIPLSDTITLWLFGDAWIGPVVENRHHNAEMISDVVAIQHGKDAHPNKLKFYYKQKDGKPAPVFTPPDSRGVFWLTGGGIKSAKGLYLIASQVIKKESDTSVFGFETTNKFILSIDNPLDEPTHWRVDIHKMPFFYRSSEGTEIDFGIPQFIKDGYIYIYGVENNKPERNRFMLLARVQEDQILNFNVWEFYSDGNWQKDFMKASRLCNQFGAEYSVSYQSSLNKYVTIYTELGMSDKIMLRTSDTPEGHWSEQEVIYRAPEVNWDKEYFCYAARGHAELSGVNDLLVSYVCNSTDFWKMVADARIYRPKFIRIKFTN